MAPKITLISLSLGKIFTPTLEGDMKHSPAVIATIRDILIRESDDVVIRQCLCILWKSCKRNDDNMEVLYKSEDTLPRFAMLLKVTARMGCYTHGQVLKFMFYFMKHYGIDTIKEILIKNFECLLLKGHFPMTKASLYAISFISKEKADVDKFAVEDFLEILYISLFQFYRNAKSARNVKYNNVKVEHALSILINFYVNDKFVQTIASLMSNGLPHFTNFIPIGIIKEAEFSEKAKMLALELLQHLDRDPIFLGNLVAFPEVLKNFKDMKNSGWDLKQYEATEQKMQEPQD